ncbi:MAG: metal-dependent hydrolase [Methanoregula sp.]|jgi:hypothetical protein|nr:metal-dependent hydrolase [Methanoregula sp.]
MFTEHVIYNLAIAIVLTFFVLREFAGWGSLIIVVSGCIPDIDGIFDLLQNHLVFTTGQLLPRMTEHSRDFHSLGALVVYAVLAGIILTCVFRLKFPVVALFAGIGFSAHLFEDALVYNPSSAVFWPISSVPAGIGIFSDYSRNFLGIANTEVLLIGMVLLTVVVVVSLTRRKISWAEINGSPEQVYKLLMSCLVGK